MRLLGSLYTIISESKEENAHSYNLRLNSGHFIYKAHFPGEPITPGVCILQIAVELLSCAVQQPLQISTVKNVKFLKIISPTENPDITYTLQKINSEQDGVKCQLSVTHADDVFAKLSIICSRQT